MTDHEHLDQDSQESWSEEIHRRGLWQVTIGYLAVGWALIEAVDILVGQGILSATAFRGALLLLALGFPVVLGTAYVQSAPARKDRTTDAAAADGLDAGFIPRSIARFLTWRNAILGGIGAFALLGMFTAGSALVRTAGLAGSGEPTIEPDRVAVLPFSVRGSPELAYLGEGIVDLVSARLDGAGPLSTVDPRVVIAGVKTQGLDPTDPGSVDRFASSLRAGRSVTGDLLEASGRLRLTAYLHTTGGDAERTHAVTVEGVADSVFPLLDDLVARLLAEIVSEDGGRLDALATLTTRSLDAAKTYLRGERQLREGQYREAARSYERAIELDTTFALAHYRRSIAADWVDAFDIRSSADRAMTYADRLSPRERGILEAVRLRRNGHVGEAEQLFRARLHQDPDDVEALVQYGELLFHDVGRQARSPLESIAPFQRALDLEPTNQIARVHLARLYALADSAARLDEVTAGARSLGPEIEHGPEFLALDVSAAPDSGGVAEVRTMLEDRPWFQRFYAVHAVLNYRRDPRLARALVTGHLDDDRLLRFLDLKAQLQLGRYAAVRDFLDRPSVREEPTWRLLEGFLAGLEVLVDDPARLEDLLRYLERTPAEVIRRGAWVPPYEDLSDRFIGYERDYYRALLLVRLGRTSEAREILGILRASDPFPGLGSVKTDAESSLEAELRLAAGDREGALAALRSMELSIPHAVTVRYLPDATRARFLRAELEAELGDSETARAYYMGLDEAWSPFDHFYRPVVYERLGRLAERQGDVDGAIAHYARFVDMWADCDPELVPIRDAVAARRDALVRDRG